MRARKRQIIKVQTVTGRGRVLTPTLRSRRVRRDAESILTAGPHGNRMELFVGNPEARALVRLDNALLAARGGDTEQDLSYVLASLRPLSAQVLNAAQECVEAYQRPHARSRGENTRARCFYRLAVALGLAASATPEDEPEAANDLQHALMRARRAMGVPRPE